MNLDDLIGEASRLSASLDAGVKTLAKAGQQVAHAEFEYRKAQAEAWLRAPEGTSPARQAWVDGEVASYRLTRDLAESERFAASSAIRARTAQVDMLRSILAAHKAEVNLAR